MVKIGTRIPIFNQKRHLAAEIGTKIKISGQKVPSSSQILKIQDFLGKILGSTEMLGSPQF